MEISEATINEHEDDLIEITISGDEDEWSEIAAALKDSDSDLATEIGLRILRAVRTAGE